jgi:hypothetical protein
LRQKAQIPLLFVDSRKKVSQKNAKMKTSITKFQLSPDSMVEETLISFSHLASCFSSDETDDENQSPTHGFPSSREERLYETGILLKEFLKC